MYQTRVRTSSALCRLSRPSRDTKIRSAQCRPSRVEMISAQHIAVLLSSVALRACAQTVTLFGISVSTPQLSQTVVEPASFSISPGGTNAAGGTTYVEVAVITSDIILKPSETFTLVSVPTTITETFVEDASGLTGDVPILPGTTKVPETCGFGTDGRGTCVISVEFANLTFSGDVVPIYTFTELPSGTASQTGAASQTTSSQNGALSHGALAVWNVLAVAAVVLVHAL
ncbi:hypothetical protein C8R45DRAFT_1214716 [Mycena sanguinolenta]|nr:hypothetical protein C8R45DRAFT_1214716 [Mycena sanguinolenta]